MAQDEMVAYVKTTGPLSVCVDASEWSTYQSGVIAYCDQDLNHCVQVTPYPGPI
jgi:Papain family cysteine protease